jgi:uncharacterized protein YabE (DUF348 family)
MKFAHKSIRSILHAHAFGFGVFVVLFSFCFFAGGLVAANGQTVIPSDSHIVSLYLDGQETVAPTRAATVGDFINKASIKLYEADLVEPSLDTLINSDNFRIQIYRARPVTIVDGDNIQRVLTPHQSPQLIAKNAGITVYLEDKLTFSVVSNFVQETILGEKLTITRATPVTISLYSSSPIPYRTQAKTVGELLTEKDIKPEAGATVVPATNSPITAGLAIFVSKMGKTVVSAEEPVDFAVETTNDPNQIMGRITITKAGVLGKKQVVYELEFRDGKEVGRKILQEVITMQPQAQIQTVGVKPGDGLSKSKGVYIFIDSKGVAHRETYYDLPMSTVMRNCGAGGNYSVRADGAKVDKDGYIIIAANLNNYPRCSIVETSIGLGKVYDTGGFAFVHPYGFDLATDWTNYDGI